MSGELLSDDVHRETFRPTARAVSDRHASVLDELRRSISTSQHDLHRAQSHLAEASSELQWWISRLGEGAQPSEPGIDVVADDPEFRRLSGRLCEREAAGCRLLHGEPSGGAAPEHPMPAPGDAGHRGVAARTRLEAADYRDAVTRAGRSGHRFRVLPLLVTTMQLADGVALLSLRQPAGPVGLLLRRAELVELARQHFDGAWVRALPVDPGRTALDAPPDADQPSEVQLEILRLAAVGAKDESIARSLGRSTRWVRRHFEMLEEQLGAVNRMTLGIAAVRRGWI
ncbi:helix-turn-helix transcriptional regulator [Micromonospora robiginosa]|uniref:Response regulator transcription factor n=1 Tax=Micromonospora robiginosa TaxID=2749844 RepID=A0A7L6BBF1_9ACTN|nr:response regulator transcription factor [Micromonospora ferruginea]QLQ38930.1 response regulator transcription factor [Micromonospora ferruginea]